MGLRGPKKKPDYLKALAGNPGKRPLSPPSSERAKRSRKGIPDRPPELTEEAAAEWDRLAPEMDAAGLLAVTDRGILSAYCLAFADMLAARKEINERGRFIEVPVQTSRGDDLGTTIKEHPAVKMLKDASNRVHKLAAELGLTPNSRFKLEGGAEVLPPTNNAVLAIRERIQAARNGVS